jgi:nicotinamide-nucleotide amidase
MNAEIIAVGSEMLTPQRIDTNSLWLTDQLNALGVEVVSKMVIGDDRNRLAEAIRTAHARSGLVILTGGLGPTEDDVTRDAVAAALGRGQTYRDELMEAIEARFRRIGRRGAIAENNRRQAFLIDGAEALPNPNGTAPGQWIGEAEGAIALLPGPPREMEPMFRDEILRRLELRLPHQVIVQRTYRIALMGESDVDQSIAPVYTRYSNPVTTILAAPGDIQLHLRARCATREEAEALVGEVGGQIEAILGDGIYSRSMDPLEAVVGAALRARGETLSVAESCTGGGVAARITAIPGSSDYFLGGFLTYQDEVKTRLVGVPEGLLKEHTAVSEPVAEAMAQGARERTGSTWGLAVTGEAGPESGSGAPVGTILIGLAGPGGVTSHRRRFQGERERVRTLASQLALDTLRRALSA